LFYISVRDHIHHRFAQELRQKIYEDYGLRPTPASRTAADSKVLPFDRSRLAVTLTGTLPKKQTVVLMLVFLTVSATYRIVSHIS